MRGWSTTRHLPCSMAPGQVAGFVVKGIRSGNGRASIPYVLPSAISLLLGAGTLNCGFPLWPESPYIRQLGHIGVFQGDRVGVEFSADAGSTFLLGKFRQSVVKVLECKQFVPM